MEDLILQSECCEKEVSFILSDGRRCEVGANVSNFLSQLSDLCIYDIMIITQKTDEQIDTFYSRYRQRVQTELTNILKGEWFWRESGDTINLDNPVILEIISNKKTTRAKLLRQVQSGKMTFAELRNIINWFKSGKDAYQKE